MRGRGDREDGQTTVEYLGVLVVVALVVGALAGGAGGMGETIAQGLRWAICTILGGECESPADQEWAPRDCLRQAESTWLEGTVKVAFVSVGGREGYTRDERSDGTVHVNWFEQSALGLTAGIGAKGNVDLPGGQVKVGARASAEAHAGPVHAETWIFANPADADAFIAAKRAHEIGEAVSDTGPVGWLGVKVAELFTGGNDLPPPDREFDGIAGGVSGELTLSGGVAEAGVQGEVSGKPDPTAGPPGVAGVERDRRTGETTLYLQVERSGTASAGLGVGPVQLGPSYARSDRSVIRLVLDEHGRPKTLKTSRLTTEGPGGSAKGSREGDRGKGSGKGSAAFTDRETLNTELDLTDPANHDIAEELLAAAIPATASAGPLAGLEAAVAAAERRAVQNGKVSLLHYDRNVQQLGGGAEVAAGLKLGLDVGYDQRQYRLVDAFYLGAPRGNGEREWVPWTACTG